MFGDNSFTLTWRVQGDCSGTRMNIGYSVSPRNNKDFLSEERSAGRGNFDQQHHHKTAHKKEPQNIVSQIGLWTSFAKRTSTVFLLLFFFFNSFRNSCWCHRSMNVRVQIPLNCFLMRALKFKLDIHGEQYIDYRTQLYRGHHHHLHQKRCKGKQAPSSTTTGQNPPY